MNDSRYLLRYQKIKFCPIISLCLGFLIFWFHLKNSSNLRVLKTVTNMAKVEVEVVSKIIKL